MRFLTLLAACAALVVSAFALSAEPLPTIKDPYNLVPDVVPLPNGDRCVTTPQFGADRLLIGYIVELVGDPDDPPKASLVRIFGQTPQAFHPELLEQCVPKKAAS